MQVFPLDLVVLGLAIFYVFQASLSGIIRVGIRILWIRVRRVCVRVCVCVSNAFSR